MNDTIENMERIRGIMIKKVRAVNLDGKAEEDVREVNFDFDRVNKALEKQIPKRPEVSSFLGHGKDHDCTKYCCPKCKSKIVSVVNGDLVGGRKSTFCPDCGQSFDWGPSEEFKQLLDTL